MIYYKIKYKMRLVSYQIINAMKGEYWYGV
ncbi:MAG: hypothetical protein ACFWUD_06915 [Thermocaproicibacter melissae]